MHGRPMSNLEVAAGNTDQQMLEKEGEAGQGLVAAAPGQEAALELNQAMTSTD